MAIVKISKQAAEQISDLPFEIQHRVAGIVDRLSKWPQVSGAKPLRGDLAGQFRVRTGDYRVQFEPVGNGRETSVIVLKVGHRDGFYDD